ncbi:hypothetical protein [Colwellia sp. PAMC 20917]|uniref:hypothetical protein n=1 Tax=Colwellia sp. PAMC 20917 TaxID=1816218 RepID=UPI0012F8C3E3|nr:hypothetical protein [Colwellia sp. PAMC 20917]
MADGVWGWLTVALSGHGGCVWLSRYTRRVTEPFFRHAEFISVSGVCWVSTDPETSSG